MTANPPRHGDVAAGRSLRSIAGRRWVPLAAATTAVVLTAGAVLTAGGGAAGASTPLSQATGRFLSGTVGSQSLDVLAGLEGEAAKNPGNPGPNQNSLNAELLNNALKIPLGPNGLQLPDPTSGAVQLGAVAQYAAANANGSALGASGAVDSNGGIGVGGSNGVPKGGATIDLAGSKAISAITSSLANLKLTIGAVSARAHQVAIGKTIDDPAASCTSGGYSRVSNKDQAGAYDIASLGLDLTSPLLSNVTTTLTNALGTLLSDSNLGTLLSTLNNGPLGGVVSITGVPTGTDLSNAVNAALDLKLANGSIEINLANGSVHVDLAGVLKFAGLDIDNLCPNTSLLPYVVSSLLKNLPGVLSSVVTSLATTLDGLIGGITVKVAGVAISGTLLGNLISTLTTSISSTLTNSLGSLDTSIVQPLMKILTDNLLDIVANAQSESGGTLTVTALQLKLLPGAGSAPAIPGFKTLPAIKNVKPNSVKVARQVRAASAAKKPAATKSGNAVHAVRLVSFTRPLATAPSGDPLVQINLAQATVGPNSPAAVTSAPGTPAPGTTAPATNVPTGVPAGQGSTGGTPSLPVILLALAAMAAAGTVISLRARGGLNRH